MPILEPNTYREMDVAKYIGLFLLKNNFCYIHGLGNLELKRKPATYNGEALVPPAYDIALGPSGSIDDNLANFIASNEQISISKASNALRDFSTQARADMAAGKEVEIPAIGKFLEEEGKIRFATDPHFKHTPPAIPTVRIKKQLEETPQLPVSTNTAKVQGNNPYMPVHTPPEEEGEEETAGLNWTRIILAAIVLLSLVALITYAIKKYNGGEDTLQPVLPTKENAAQVPVAPVPGIDTSANAPAVNQGVTVQNGVMKFKAIIDSYKDLAKAQKRTKQMISYGHNVELISEDSSTFFVVMPMSCAPQDTARVLDSLGDLFNPGKVVMY
jgi:nucleoid DNA-binding protein